MIGLAAENIVAGTLSDSFGRKKPLIIAMILFTIASVLCAFASNAPFLMAARFLQGATGGRHFTCDCE